MLSSTNSSTLRVILRIYFVVTLLLLCIVGQQCCKSIVKLRLLQRRPVNVIRMTGWLRSLDLLTIIAQTKRIPGGALLGTGMVLATLLAPVGDFLVSGLVKSVQVPGTCQFGRGMVFSTSTDNRIVLVPVNGRPYTVSANAQANSLRNGGLAGIYKKVNDDSNFRATPHDVLGGWKCAQFGQDVTYLAGSDVFTAGTDLIQRGNVYSQQYSQYSGSRTQWTHFVMVGYSIASGADSSQSIRVAMDLTANNTDAQVMRTFDCKIDTSALDNTLNAINFTSTIKQWIPAFQGAVYMGSGTPAAANASAIYETVLNSLVMVAGGRNYLLATPPANDDTQGCLVTRTSMPIIVIAFAVLTGTMFLAAAIYAIVLELRINLEEQKRRDLAKDTFKQLPDGLVTWMLHAIRERTYSSLLGAGGVAADTGYYVLHFDGVENNKRLSTKELLRWNFVVDGNMMRLEKDIDPAAQPMAAPPMYGAQDQFMATPFPMNYDYGYGPPKGQAHMGQMNEVYPQ